MKTDAYTKIVLTIIAICLIWLCAGSDRLFTAVHAESPLQEVIIAGVKGPAGLPVSIQSPTSLPVSIQEINVVNPWDSLRAKQQMLPIFGEVKTRQ